MKPRVSTSREVLAHIDKSKPVRVYRNLHKNCVSVRQGGIVKCHAENVVLKDCKFIVSAAGQRRVRDEKKKNVHAFIQGYVFDSREADKVVDGSKSDEEILAGDTGWQSVYYNPYSTDHWQLSNVPYDEYVDTADFCDVWCDNVFSEVLTYNPKFMKLSP